MSFVNKGAVEKGSLAAPGAGEEVLVAWKDWDCNCEGCGELLVLVMGVLVWRRVRMALRMGRVSRDEGEMSVGRVEEPVAWDCDASVAL